MPISYRIRRLDPPTRPPLTKEQIAERAAQFVGVTCNLIRMARLSLGPPKMART